MRFLLSLLFFRLDEYATKRILHCAVNNDIICRVFYGDFSCLCGD